MLGPNGARGASHTMLFASFRTRMSPKNDIIQSNGREISREDFVCVVAVVAKSGCDRLLGVCTIRPGASRQAIESIGEGVQASASNLTSEYSKIPHITPVAGLSEHGPIQALHLR